MTAKIDDYRDEFLIRLQKSDLYTTLKEQCSDKDNDVIALVDDAVSYAYQRTKTVLIHMGEFTLHDGDHLFRVLNLMERLLGEKNIKQLTPPELMLLILCAFFHDIGMAPGEKEVQAWKKVWDLNPHFEDESELLSFEGFKRYYNSKPDQHEALTKLMYQGKNSQAEVLKGYIITEYIRQSHAERAREVIATDWNGKIKFRDVDLTVELAQLCYSHNEDALNLLDLDQTLLCAPNMTACLPLIGVILRLADILDFDAKRTPPMLFSHLYVRNPISLKEWSKHRAIEAWQINGDLIQYYAKCNHPAIEASIHEFCDIIDHELSTSNNIISIITDSILQRDLIIKIPLKVNRDKIKTQTNIYNKPLYIYKNTQFNLSKKQVIELLMGTKLYGNPQVALRELLQNSIDACLLRQAQETKWKNLYVPEVTVKYYQEGEDTILEVDDNGTGMDQYIIDNYYSKVGSSFYKSTDFFNLKSESNADFTPTSRFGIGILSCFMVSDTLIVDTKRILGPHKSSEALNVTVEGQESIFSIKEGSRDIPGTTTKLILRKSKNPWENMDEEQFISSVENIIPNPPFKINIITQSHQKIRDQNSFSEVTAISLKDFSWRSNENIKLIEMKFTDKSIGIIGSATVAILESHGKPVKEVATNVREIEIEGSLYSLDKHMKMKENSISESSKTITITDNGDIREDSSSREFARSMSRLSLHGIEVPTTLFPDYWMVKNNQVRIAWPFPLIIVVDICNKRDLDLNSPRTEIILSEKWADFEEQLAYEVCKNVSKSVDKDYWNQLKAILGEGTKSEHFLAALSRLEIEN